MSHRYLMVLAMLGMGCSFINPTWAFSAAPDAGTVEDRDAGPEGPDTNVPMPVTFPDRDPMCAPTATPPCATDQERSSAEERTVLVAPAGAGGTYAFVIAQLSIPQPTALGAAGFNLDGNDSGAGTTNDPYAPCDARAPDFGGTYDAALVGVDNAFAIMVPITEGFLEDEATVDGVIAAAIADGSLLMVMEISEVDDWTYDQSVVVQFFGVRAQTTYHVDESGRPVGGQPFETIAQLGPPSSGDIFAGRLRTRAASLRVPLPVDTPLLLRRLDLNSVEVRVDVSEASATRGVVGGALDSADFARTTTALWPMMAGVVEEFALTLADVQPSASDATICERLSAGLTFEAVQAFRTPL